MAHMVRLTDARTGETVSVDPDSVVMIRPGREGAVLLSKHKEQRA